MSLLNRSWFVYIATFFGLVLAPGFAAAGSFSDVPESHYAYDAIEFLKQNGIISGYEDGTYKPNKGLNRAEAAKFIMAPLRTAEQLAAFNSTGFADIAADAWFLPYVEAARTAGVIDSPKPEKGNAFFGGNGLIKVEFLKMLQVAHGANPESAFSEIKLPLSADVQNPNEWFYPYLRYAIASSMTMIGTDGNLKPANQVSRADAALLLYRLMMYKEGRRTQALLSEAESEILVILGMLEKNDITQAEYASARSLIAARGAHASRSDDPIVVGALKIAEAFRALTSAYRAGVGNDFEQVIALSKQAWGLAEQAKGAAPELATLTDQVQKISGNMADSAREQQALN